MLFFNAFYFSKKGVYLIMMVFLRLGNLFLRGFDIYRFVEDSFHAVEKYLFSSCFNLAYNSNTILLLSSTFPISSLFSAR